MDDRLREPSTMAGAGLVANAILAFVPATYQAIAYPIVNGLLGLAAMLMHERGGQ